MNVDKIGDYEIVYKMAQKAKAIVHVRDDSQLEVKDTTIYVGDKWKQKITSFPRQTKQVKTFRLKN